MTQVSNEAELRAALVGLDQEIEIVGDFTVARQVNITYSTTIHSAAGAVHTLSKGADFIGSLFRIRDGGGLTLTDIILDGSNAGTYEDNPDNRTLVMVAGGSAHLGAGAVLQNNSSYQEGGGAYVSGDVSYSNQFLMDGDARIQGCASRTSGGGLMVALRSNDDRAVLAGQAAITNNSADNGGGIYFNSYLAGVGGTLVLGDQIRVTDNRAASGGGGICFSGYRGGGSLPATLTIGGNAEVSSNRASFGGGVYFFSANAGDRFSLLSAATVARNSTTGNGGGIYLVAPTGGVDFQIRGASVAGNTGVAGGGVYLRSSSGGSVDFTDAEISSNTAAGASGYGGGMWVQNTSDTLSLVFSGVNFNSNHASNHGGGMFLSNSAVIRLNAAGGGFRENTADSSGGGIYCSNIAGTSTQISMDGVMVSDNTAGLEGGGLRLGSGNGSLETTLTDCTVTGNTADGNSGGGLWQGGARDTLLIRGDTAITRNRTEAGNGGGIYFNSDDGTITLSENVKVTYNHADGRDSSFGNHGGGICIVPGRLTVRDQVEIAYNSAGKYGGGISAAETSTVTVSGGDIHDNHAGLEGGGVWNHVSSAFTMAGGSLSNNTAAVGGGLYNDVLSTASILGGTLRDNASDTAPGIYNNGVLYTEGIRELSNGLYIVQQNAVARLTGALASGSVIQLDPTGYVTPNPDGTPIVVGAATPQHPLLTQTDADGFRKPPVGFDGWEIRLNDDRTQIILVPEVYSIQYENLFGAQNPNPPDYTVTTPDIALADSGPLPGRIFTGWFTAPIGGRRVTQIQRGSTGDLVLYARWEDLLHTIVYDGNSAEPTPAKWVPSPVHVRDGGSVIVPRSIPVRDTSRFTGWNTERSGSGASYQPGQTISPVTADITLYAQWG